MLELMKKNAFLRAPKIRKNKLLRDIEININNNYHSKIFNEEGFSWKEPVIRVKMEWLKNLWLLKKEIGITHIYRWIKFICS